MEQKKRTENIMGTKPVRPLLVGMAVPIMLSMLVQALYNVVDSIFVAQVSEDAVTAVGYAFPIQNLMIAVSVGTGLGINALLSRRIGEKDYVSAQRITNNGVFITLITWALFALGGGLGSAWYMSLYDTTEAIRQMTVEYLQICTVFGIGLFMSITLERLLQVTGKSTYQMITQMAGAVTNIILDPVFIFGWLGLPAMGVTGAAVATVIGQCVSMCVGLILNRVKNHEVQIKLRGFRPHIRTIAEIYTIGLPSIVLQSVGSIMTFGLNYILTGFGSTPVAVFGVYFKLQSFVFMPVFGITNALVPIVGYNYGARQRRRIDEATKLATIGSVGIMLMGTLLFCLVPDLLLLPFNPTEQFSQIARSALRLISISFPLAGVSIMLGSVLQAMGSANWSLLTSVVRQLVVLLPCAFILANIIGVTGVWLSFSIAEVVGFGISVWSYMLLRRTKLRALDAAQ